jgi:hypothetical protein
MGERIMRRPKTSRDQIESLRQSAAECRSKARIRRENPSDQNGGTVAADALDRMANQRDEWADEQEIDLERWRLYCLKRGSLFGSDGQHGGQS